MGDIIGVREAAAMTGYAVGTMYNLRSLGVGPRSFRLRGSVRYYRSDVADWMRAEEARTVRG